jgi:DNA-binding PadR family transcriptional regulator
MPDTKPKRYGARESISNNRLKRAGYVESIDIPAKRGKMKPIKKSLYSITPKGIRLLKGWLSFLLAYK